MNWSHNARAIIREIETCYRDRPLADLRRALRTAYPWGHRQDWPYKCWRKEQRLALLRHPEAAHDNGALFEHEKEIDT